MTPALARLKTLIDDLAGKINAPEQLLPTYGHSIDGAHPHIEADDNGLLYYVVMERGQELRRDIALDTDDLLYRVFEGVTFSMAVQYELQHRKENEDFRRQLFARQVELLGKLNDLWGACIAEKHRQILTQYPFNDAE